MPGIIQPLFTLGFWFNLSAMPFTPWASWLIIGLMGALVLLGAVLYVYVKKFGSHIGRERKHVMVDFAILCFWSGVFGFLLYGLNAQSVPVLSMRFFWLLLLLVFALVFFYLAKRWFKTVPLLEKSLAEKEAYEKWLPRPKRK